MQFPVPSETFASLDVESLRVQGHEVSVYALRSKHRKYETMMAERGHDELFVHHLSFRAVLTAFGFCILHPIMTMHLLVWLVKTCFQTPKHIIKSLALLPSTLSIFSAVYKNKPDVVHLFWGHYPSMVGFLVKAYMPTTTLTQFLGAHDLVSNYPAAFDLAKRGDALFTHSRSNLELLGKNGIPCNLINVVFRGTSLNFSHKEGFSKFNYLNEPVFLTASRLIEDKGTDDVLKIFSEILKIYPKAVLNIAGEGEYKKELIELAKTLNCIENVNFIGHLKQSDLVKYMSKSHFFLLMSRYAGERLPNVAKEAMYQKCIVVTTDTNGIDELIKTGENGFIVNKYDVSTGKKKIINCISNVDYSIKIADMANKQIKNNFDVNVSMRKYIDVWDKLVKLHSTRVLK